MTPPLAITGVIVLPLSAGEQNLLLTLRRTPGRFFVMAIGVHGGLARTPRPRNISPAFMSRLSFVGMVGGIVSQGDRAVYIFVIAETRSAGIGGAVPPARRSERLPRWSGSWDWPGLLAGVSVALIAPSLLFGEQGDDRLDDQPGLGDGGRPACLSSSPALRIQREPLKISATVAVAPGADPAYPAITDGWKPCASFFGVHKDVVTPHGQYHWLRHGTTISQAPEIPERRRHAGGFLTGRPILLKYYHKVGASARRSRRFAAQGRTASASRYSRPRSGTLTCAPDPARPGSSSNRSIDGHTVARPQICHLYSELGAGLKPVIGYARLPRPQPDGNPII